MARTLRVYPKAVIAGSTWTLLVKVNEPGTGTNSRFDHTVVAGVTITGVPLRLLKFVFGLVVDDTDTDQEIDDALFFDDIKPGPQVETVWGNWQDLAEGILGGLPADTDELDFWAEWSKSNTAGVRNDARRALITQRGWTIPAGTIHQHEGDSTVLEA